MLYLVIIMKVSYDRLDGSISRFVAPFQIRIWNQTGDQSQKALSYFILLIKCSLRMALNIFLIALTVPKLSRFNCENPLSGSRFESGNGATNLEMEPSSRS